MEKGPERAIKPFKSDFNTERMTEILFILSDFMKYLLLVTSTFLSLGKNVYWQSDLYGNHSRARRLFWTKKQILPSAYEAEMWMTLSEFSPCVFYEQESEFKEGEKGKRGMRHYHLHPSGLRCSNLLNITVTFASRSRKGWSSSLYRILHWPIALSCYRRI